MTMDVDIIKMRANGDYRLSKVRGECMISVRIPGALCPRTYSVPRKRSPKNGAMVSFTSPHDKNWRCPAFVMKTFQRSTKHWSPSSKTSPLIHVALMSKTRKQVISRLVGVISSRVRAVESARRLIPIPLAWHSEWSVTFTLANTI